MLLECPTCKDVQSTMPTEDVTLKASFAYATKCGFVCTYHQFVRAIAHQSLGEIKSKRLANASEEGKCVYH